jgi:hypothetical protein
MTDKPTITEQITEYLTSGGLFNPELMPHEKVRDLLVDCRDELNRIHKLELDLHFQKLQKAEWACYACMEKSKAAADEIERLKKKCDYQASVLRRLTPEKFPNTIFISGTLGERDQNNMPQKLLVVPAYGVDFSYIYERTEKTTGPEW